MVRLKVPHDWHDQPPQVDFNSKVVRLKVRLLNRFHLELNYFNSKVVRLKDGCGVNIFVEVALFQFQSGAVKSQLLVLRLYIHILISIPKWCG